jgi:hypothetical protein
MRLRLGRFVDETETAYHRWWEAVSYCAPEGIRTHNRLILSCLRQSGPGNN